MKLLPARVTCDMLIPIIQGSFGVDLGDTIHIKRGGGSARQPENGDGGA